VLHCNVTSRMSFKRIYQNRPNHARYAIAGNYSVEMHADRYVAWDLFDVKKNPSDNELIEPAPTLVHNDVDAAIMATLMLYERR
jgi:hypothetical protein